jgi:anti-sigma B factor antagonist
VGTADYEVNALGPCAVIRMPAEIDVTNTDQVRSALLAAVKKAAGKKTGVTKDPRCLIIDMGGTTFCDSSGVQALLAAHRDAAAAGTRLWLVAPLVERILTLVGIDQLIPTYPTIESAQAAAVER